MIFTHSCYFRVDLKSRPEHMLRQSSLLDKVRLAKSPEPSYPCMKDYFSKTLLEVHSSVTLCRVSGFFTCLYALINLLLISFVVVMQTSDEPLASSDDEDIGVVPELSFKAYQKSME